jgi:hypothetical protein
VQVVQFGTESASELVGHADEVDAGRCLPVSTRPRGQVLQDLQVLVHLLHGAGAANLDDDIGSVVKRRGVRLADGGARQRLGVEGRESCIPTALKLASDNVLDDLRGNTRSGVLELDELDQVVTREQVSTRGDELAKLDERRPELLESRTQLLGRRVGLLARSATQQALFQRQQTSETDDVHQIDHAVTSQDFRDLQLAMVGSAHR